MRYALPIAWTASVIAALSVTLATPSYSCTFNNDGRKVCGSEVTDANGNEQQAIIIGGRPAGCPHRYCGCGLRKHLGLNDTRLNLAWNWAVLFPRTSLRPGVAAVRRGHVLYVESVVDYASRTVIARDYNSGRGLSRIHERKLGRNYVFVDPSTRIAEVRR